MLKDIFYYEVITRNSIQFVSGSSVEEVREAVDALGWDVVRINGWDNYETPHRDALIKICGLEEEPEQENLKKLADSAQQTFKNFYRKYRRSEDERTSRIIMRTYRRCVRRANAAGLMVF